MNNYIITAILLFVICIIGSFINSYIRLAFNLFPIHLFTFIVKYHMKVTIPQITGFLYIENLFIKLRYFTKCRILLLFLIPAQFISIVGTLTLFSLKKTNSIMTISLGFVLIMQLLIFLFFSEKTKFNFHDLTCSEIVVGTISSSGNESFAFCVKTTAMYFLQFFESNEEYFAQIPTSLYKWVLLIIIKIVKVLLKKIPTYQFLIGIVAITIRTFIGETTATCFPCKSLKQNTYLLSICTSGIFITLKKSSQWKSKKTNDIKELKNEKHY